MAGLMLASTITGCQKTELIIEKPDDAKNAKIGVMTGTTGEMIAKERFPQAQIKSFDDIMDAVAAIKSSQLDAIVTAYPTAFQVSKKNPELTFLKEPLKDEGSSISLTKGKPDQLKELNRIIAELKHDGTLEDLKKRWFKPDLTPYQELAVPAIQHGPVLKVGLSATREPLCFVDGNGKITGHDGELARIIAAKLKRPVEFSNMKFMALIPAVVSNKVDLIFGLTETVERKKSVDFSHSYFLNPQVLLVRKPASSATITPDKSTQVSSVDTQQNSRVTADTTTTASPSLFKGIAVSFHSNILHENRFLLILDGLKTTVIISILASLAGTLLGALVCFMRMSKKSILAIPAKIYISILRGTPVLVLLMLIFYVVFASVSIDPVFVAVIAFGMNFAAYSAEIFRSGIEGIDTGQSEAGIALGFTRFQTFLHIIMPQMVQRVLPVYKGEFISLVKMTSIVGYIAVQDLTKASDIIRSRTFDAFFPLVMVAVLYFLISWLLLQVLEFFERKCDPKQKNRKVRAR
jgi:polar amino acid transport system substrate-binding protein